MTESLQPRPGLSTQDRCDRRLGHSVLAGERRLLPSRSRVRRADGSNIVLGQLRPKIWDLDGLGVLVQPPPAATCSDVSDRLSGHTELGCDVFDHHSGERTDLSHIVGCELLVGGAPALETITGVPARTSQVEVSGVHARWHVTGVQDPLPPRDGPVVQEPGDTVGPDHALAVPQDTVAERLLSACLPKPAVIRPSYFDLCPEPVSKWRAIRCSAHGLRAARSLPSGVVHSAPSPRLDLDGAIALFDVAHEGGL